jgi:hypothetical protein
MSERRVPAHESLSNTSSDTKSQMNLSRIASGVFTHPKSVLREALGQPDGTVA